MAKKIVRGITDVKTITNQDFDTNNVNDLLSDGQYNYIHRKKGKTEEYHNLTDNIKTLSSDNTELLSVTNYNKTTNTATLHPKHDAQKEQLLESTRNTISIHHGENATAEKTTVDTNPQKVLEHENLLTDYGISKTTTGNNTTLGIEYTRVPDGFDLNDLTTGFIQGTNLVNAPYQNTWFFVEAFTHTGFAVQKAIHMGENIPNFSRYKANGQWSDWKNQVGDKSVIDGLLAQKQDVLTAGDGITIQDNVISATGGGGATHAIQDLSTNDFNAIKHDVTIGHYKLTTFSFELYNENTEIMLTDELKEELKYYVHESTAISNGALTISNDGTTMKLINSAPSQGVYQHGTFTFLDFSSGGGEGGGGSN